MVFGLGLLSDFLTVTLKSLPVISGASTSSFFKDRLKPHYYSARTISFVGWLCHLQVATRYAYWY